MANRYCGTALGLHSFAPDLGSHPHSAGFSHQPRIYRSGSRLTEELVQSTPPEDAGVGEVRTWVLEVFHRRCHPDPKRALNGFYWKGRDLHSQRRYLALRLRFRREPYGYLIAHDIHDAVKEFRKRTRQREKEAAKRVKKRNRTDKGAAPESASTTAAQGCPSVPSQFPSITPSKDNPEEEGFTERHAAYMGASRERQSSHPIGEDQLQDAETSRVKVKKKLAKIFTISPQTSSSSSSRATTRTESASGEDPFQDPIPSSRKTKAKTRKAKRRGKAKARLKSRHNVQDPFRDPEPMRLIDEDDFRLECPLSTGRSNALRGEEL
ncbi:hypothetical protein GGR51DRAFT_575285 [Nemania sp. FL0031]|nr:hypothetical protein GGR51DRAFT_575285 [Nemania sp. FL0031]